MNYVALYIDLEFIVGTVCTDNGDSYSITNGSDNFLWLYFYNDPRTNTVSFGKSNLSSANKNIQNYYGHFFNLIENEMVQFRYGEFQKDAIELLEYSNLLKTIKDKYSEVTKESPNHIPTLLTFSLSVSELAKQKLVEYLKRFDFQIQSYTIPLAELTANYQYSKQIFVPPDRSIIVLLAATNSDLHIMKLVFLNDYFKLDGEVKTYKGMGIDPRKRAIVGYVVTEINKSVGALSEGEIPAEIAKKEYDADDWLRRIDTKSTTDKSPIRIVDSLSLMPNTTKEVLVKRSDIESFTNGFVNHLMDLFDAYIKNIKGKTSAIFLLGDCFNNTLVKNQFEKLINGNDGENLFLFTNNDIHTILSVYPKIDINRYLNEEERIKAHANEEEREIKEQRKSEKNHSKEQEEENLRISLEKQIEENKQEAKNFYERALTLKMKGKLQDAIANVENAIKKDDENSNYQNLLTSLKDEQNEITLKTKEYKSLLLRAEKLIHKDEFEKAIAVYELAKDLFDNIEIQQFLSSAKEKVEEKNKQEVRIRQILSKSQIMYEQGMWTDAKEILLPIEQVSDEAKLRIQEINIRLQEIEIEFRTLVKIADNNLKNKLYQAAIDAYENALKIRPDEKIQAKLHNVERIAEYENEENLFNERIKEVKLLIAAHKWIDARSVICSLQKTCSGHHNDLKEYNKQIFEGEENEKSSSNSADIGRIGFKVSQKYSDDFFTKDIPTNISAKKEQKEQVTIIELGKKESKVLKTNSSVRNASKHTPNLDQDKDFFSNSPKKKIKSNPNADDFFNK